VTVHLVSDRVLRKRERAEARIDRHVASERARNSAWSKVLKAIEDREQQVSKDGVTA